MLKVECLYNGVDATDHLVSQVGEESSQVCLLSFQHN
jgi:hypothetical protein